MSLFYKRIPYKTDGFGIVGKKLEKYLSEIPWTTYRDVDFYYNHPNDPPDEGREDHYSIMYMPWESTGDRPGWLTNMSFYDEIWVPTPWVKSVVEGWGYEAFVYEHGMDDIWTPKLREPKDKLIFLFQGFESKRKGAYEVIHAFNNAFRNIDDVELWIKTKTVDTPNFFPKIKFIEGEASLKELVELYHQAHVMVAPTWGEGFGIPSRDALGTGMPLIHTGGFAPYENFMHPDLIIDSKKVDSPWQDIHPGKMFEPNVDHLEEIFKRVYDEHNLYAKDAYEKSAAVHEYYDWSKLTNDAFFALEQRLAYTG
jgi:glycosyltransferase involved in cell wall biosynthesis